MRARLAAVALLAMLLGVGATLPRATAQDDQAKVLAEKQAEIDRLMNEKDELLREIQRLRMGAGAGVPVAGDDPLSRSVSLDLREAALPAALRQLGEAMRCEVKAGEGVPAKATVSLRFKDLPGRTAVDLVCWNARDHGRALELAWNLDERTILIQRAGK